MPLQPGYCLWNRDISLITFLRTKVTQRHDVARYNDAICSNLRLKRDMKPLPCWFVRC